MAKAPRSANKGELKEEDHEAEHVRPKKEEVQPSGPADEEQPGFDTNISRIHFIAPGRLVRATLSRIDHVPQTSGPTALDDEIFHEISAWTDPTRLKQTQRDAAVKCDRLCLRVSLTRQRGLSAAATA